MKKLLCLLIVGAMSLTLLAGCGNTSTAGTSVTPSVIGTPGDIVNPDDKYTDSTKDTGKTKDTQTTVKTDRTTETSKTTAPQNTTSSTTEGPTVPGQNNDSWMKSLSGTERAKLLLANQRLDATVLNTNGNLFENGEEVMHNLIDIAISNLGVQYADKADLTPVSETITDEFGTRIELGDKTVRWFGFMETNNSYSAFLSHTENIVTEAEAGANLIGFVKKNIRIVNKWVAFGEFSRYYLQVDANSETLYYYNKDFDGIEIVKRYKNEAGKDVYEMYRKSTDYEKRTLYIPGERYEFTDSYQYFTADNSKGYWEVYSMNEASSHYNVSYFIMKDNICYDAFYNPENGDIPMLKVMSADRKADIFNISTYTNEEFPETNTMHVDVKFSGFDGVAYVETPRDKMASHNYNGVDLAYTTTDMESVSVYMENGRVINYGDTYYDGKIQLAHLMVSHYSLEGYVGEVAIRIKAPTWEEQVEMLKTFLNEMGFVCRRDINGVFEGIDLAYEELDSITKYYKWNGINVSTEEGIAAGVEKERERMDAIMASYDAIKNEEVVTYTSSEDMEIHINFAPIARIETSGASIDGTAVNVPSFALTVNDTILFVEEEPYIVMFALKASNGSLVHLDVKNETEVKYAGESEFTVNTEKASFELTEIAPGEYTVVCYIATADGIRSSGFTELKFTEAKNLPVQLSSSELSAEIGEDGVIKLTYTEKLDHYVSKHSIEALDFEKFKAIVGEKAFEYGTPKDDVIEKLVGEEYVPLTGEETEIESGTYRIFYSANNGTVSRNGYVYISYERRVPEAIESFEELDYAGFKAKADEIAAKHGVTYTVIEKLAGEEWTALTGEEATVEVGIYRIPYVVNEGEEAVTEYIYVELVKAAEEPTPENPNEIDTVIESSVAYDYATFKVEVDILAKKYGISYTVIEKLVGEEYVPLTGEETAIEAGDYRITQVVGEGEEGTTKCVNIHYIINAYEEIPGVVQEKTE